jgi:hypothetical protein
MRDAALPSARFVGVVGYRAKKLASTGWRRVGACCGTARSWCFTIEHTLRTSPGPFARLERERRERR